MATYTYINEDLDILKEVFDASGLFDSTEVGTTTISGQSATTKGIICYRGTGDDKRRIFELGYGTAQIGGSPYGNCWSVSVNALNFKAFYSGILNTSAPNGNRTNYRPSYTYSCANGILLFGDTGRLLLTKNQLGKFVGVFGDSGSTNGSTATTAQVMTSFKATCEDDDYTNASNGLGSRTNPQTLLEAICTRSTTPSYTDKAFLLAYRPSVNIGYIQYGGKRYFTDGFFAVEDPEV